MAPSLKFGVLRCECNLERHGTTFIAVTGGPGGGKSAILAMAAQYFCSHVAVLPEAASIVFGGGFPRHPTDAGRRAAQRAIYHVQSELERLVAEESRVAVALCDRGTLDGLAYWPAQADTFWAHVGSTFEAELKRYASVIHMETPLAQQGYNHENRLRIENAQDARQLDDRILSVWSGHPRRFVIGSSENFVDKAFQALKVIRSELPPCCHSHALPHDGAG